jgi:hypothetical protein
MLCLFVIRFLLYLLKITSAHGLLETRKKLEELVAWATPILTRDHEYIWLEVNGIPYPIKADNLETSSKPCKYRNNPHEHHIKRGAAFNLL